jgi:hypothetical protein
MTENNLEEKEIQYTCVPILIPVTNGILSGIASVISVYFFKPIWNRITKLWQTKEIEIITNVEKK